MWSQVGQGGENKRQCQTKGQKRCRQSENRKPRRRTSHCIRRRFSGTLGRCTACTAITAAVCTAVCTAIAHSHFASPIASTCHPTGTASQAKDPFASKGQSHWKGRRPDCEIGRCFGHTATELANICSRHANPGSEKASGMREFPTCCQCRTRPTEERASWTFDQIARRSQSHSECTYATNATGQGSAKHECHGFPYAIQHSATADICPATSSHGSRHRFKPFCTNHATRPGDTGAASKCPKTHACTNLASQQCKQSDNASTNDCFKCTAHASSGVHPPGSKARDAVPDATRKLGMATSATCIPRHAIVAASGIPDGCTDNEHVITRDATRHPCTAVPNAYTSTAGTVQYGTADGLFRTSRSSFIADAGDCCQRAQRIIYRSRWGGRERTQCISCPTVDPIRTTATDMSCADQPVQPKHANIRTAHAPRGYATAIAQESDGVPKQRASNANRVSSCCIARTSGHTSANHTQTGHTRTDRSGDNVGAQLPVQTFPCRVTRSSKVLPVTERSTSDEDTQAPAGQHICPTGTWRRSTSAFIGWKQITDTCTDRSSDGNRAWRDLEPGPAAVGIGSCEGLRGSSVLQADSFGATHDKESPKALQTGPTILLLDKVIPMTHKEVSMHSVRELYPLLCKPWPDHSMLWGHDFVHLLPDLDPAIRDLITSNPPWNHEPVLEIHLYIDGSSFENRQQPQDIQAAWAFIIVAKCQIDCNVGYRMYAATSHQLSSASMNSTEFHGVGEVSQDALSAEASGMLVCMAWVAQSPFQVVHVLHYDNATVGQFAAGEIIWNAGWEHSQLKANLTAMRHCFQALKKDVLFQHVKAHQGHPMNETADALAKSTAKGIILNMPIPCEVSRVMLNRNLPMAWMTLSPASEVPLPYALPGLFKAEGPTSSLPPDPTWYHAKEEVEVKDVAIRIHAATANVLTLAPGAKSMQAKGLMTKGRIHMLQSQFQHAKVNVIGVQESRTQDQVTRHNGTHLVFQSGASTEGSRGCELWLDRTIPYATSAKEKHCFQPNQVHIARADDRSLLAIIRAPHLMLRILVLHAPHQAAKDVPYEQWWTDIQATVQTVNPHIPIIILGDMNAKLGSVSSVAVDSHGAEEENKTGHQLHAFMLECRLWAPSTFEQHHEGPTFTWISSEGASHRLDFALLPQDWKSFDVRSKMLHNVDLCTIRDDHMPISIEVRMSKRQSTCAKPNRCRIDVRKCSDPESQQQFLAHLRNPPNIPWEVGIGEHAEILTQWLQDGAIQCFKPSKTQPRQKYLSDLTWNIVQTRKQLLQLMRNAEFHNSNLLLAMVFQVWREMSTSSPSSPMSDSSATPSKMLPGFCMGYAPTQVPTHSSQTFQPP